MTFRDHFSTGSAAYAEFRPRYPGELFDLVAGAAPGRRAAWDCATGSGQAACDLAARFERVVATDASAAQIAAAFPHPRIEYRVALAEDSGLAPASIDLVTVAQSLHWFDLERFWREAERVLVPGGAIAVWCYTMLRVDPAVDAVVDRFYGSVVGPYWPPERRLVDEGYRGIDFPFDELSVPPQAIEQVLTLGELAGYVRTWSATKRYVEARGEDPVPALLAELRGVWGGPDVARSVLWPIHLRLGRTRARR